VLLTLLSPGGNKDFTFTGADTSSWGSGWTFTQGTGDILTNRGRMVTGTGGFDGRSAWYNHGTVDVNVRIDLEIPTNDAQFPEVRARFSTSNYDYVRLLFEPHNDVVRLHSYDNDVQIASLDSATFAVAGGDVVHIRIVSVGDDTKVRLWRNTDPEPGTWDLEGTTTLGATNTSLMVRTVTSNLGVAVTNYWDNFSYVATTTFPSPISQSDTGSGADAQTVDQGGLAINQSDTGSGADTETSAAALTVTETGAGADNQTVAVPVSQSDTGSGADAQTFAVAFTGTETGSGADAQSSTVAATQAETGSGADSQTLAVASTQADTGAGSDTQTRAIALTVASTANSGPSSFQATTLSVTAPSGLVAGDTVVIVVQGHNFSGSTHTFSISGFTSRVASTYMGHTAIQIFDKIAGGSEPSSYTVDITNTAYTSAHALRISGPAIFDVAAADDSNGAFDGDHNLPSVTTTAANTLAIGGISGYTDSVTTPSGWTSLGVIDASHYTFHRTWAAAGATGATTVTPLDTDRWSGAHAAWRPDIAVQVSSSDTGSGVDAQGSRTFLQPETGAGTDSQALAVALTVTENGAGSETQLAATPINQSDTGSGADGEVVGEGPRAVVEADEARGYDLFWIRKVARLTALSAYTNDRSGLPVGADLGEGDLIARARSRRRGWR
jgi:hypothetical protein